MNETKLKPCPFCGGTAELTRGHISMPIWYVMCDKCGLVASFRKKEDKESAYISWNRRANNV